MEQTVLRKSILGHGRALPVICKKSKLKSVPGHTYLNAKLRAPVEGGQEFNVQLSNLVDPWAVQLTDTVDHVTSHLVVHPLAREEAECF